MDASHFTSNVINNVSTSYPSSESSTPQHLQPSSLPPHSHTLPPLHHNHANNNSHVMQPGYGSYPHTPRTPATPNTPGSASTMGSYPPPTNAAAGRGTYQMMASNPYQPPQQSYATSSAMLPQTSTALSHPQPIAPAPSPAQRGPPVLRPMPTGGVMPQPGMSSPYGQGAMMPQPSMLPEGDQPTHVVGSQGRRGILPSAPGRPAPPPAGTASTKTQVPQKDADGKFPCPHCNKTYLHAKHLKRHLLRHTGDRPYMCVLCRDTFSRSDILKRHFQKCSIRRGNPTGASHLSHPHAHVKKNPAGQKALGEGGEMNQMNGMGNMSGDGMPFGLIAAPDTMSNMANDQNQLSRSSSMNRLEDPNSDRERRNVAGAVMGGASNRGGSFDQSYNGNPNNMNANINPQLANYSVPQSQNGLPMFGNQTSGQQSSLDWSSMFQPGAQDTYANTFPPNIGQTQNETRPEPSADTVRPGGVPGDTHNDLNDHSLFFENWSSQNAQDPYQQLSNRILSFFYPSDYTATAQATSMTLFFSPENIKDFLEKYTHFHVHFPILHIPTFKILDAYTGLLAGMCCIGACYSDRVSAGNVRDMMAFLRSALERDSRILASFIRDPKLDMKDDEAPLASSPHDVEELQAIVLMHTLCVWNGTPGQREVGRQMFPVLGLLVHKACLLTVSKSTDLYSPLHQPEFRLEDFDRTTFDWLTWVEQEKRIRLLYSIFSFDAALGLYFNSSPLFDPFDVQIPLPSDDAAWDAPNGQDCAGALGLRDPRAANALNPDGTQRPKQPEMHLALRALLHSSYQIQTGTTNLYGKFLIIHGLLALIRKTQMEGLAAIVMKDASTPLGQKDWVVGGGQDVVSAHGSASNSGRATPVEGTHLPQTFKMFVIALDKFKRNWDYDMATQFPPSTTNPRRYGFSRDGIHYYWLATYLLKHTRPGDLGKAPDERFTDVMHLLKSLKKWVMSDGALRGEELGSIGDIDMNYGAQNLTLDMVSLFKPVPKVEESPGISSV